MQMLSIHNWLTYFNSISRRIDFLEPSVQSVFLLILRIWVAMVFFQSGLTKIASMESTYALFEYEYNVPLLNPIFAAWSATLVELILPPLLIIGIATRPVAFIILILNFIAMHSYPDISPAGTKQHELWQLGLIIITLFGAYKISIDYWLTKTLASKNTSQQTNSN